MVCALTWELSRREAVGSNDGLGPSQPEREDDRQEKTNSVVPADNSASATRALRVRRAFHERAPKPCAVGTGVGRERVLGADADGGAPVARTRQAAQGLTFSLRGAEPAFRRSVPLEAIVSRLFHQKKLNGPGF